MLHKAHLTSYSRMSGSRRVTTPSWLSRSLRLFCTVLLCILAISSWPLRIIISKEKRWHFSFTQCPWGFPGDASGKEPACRCRRNKTRVQSLGQGRSLEEGTATHSSILAWRIPWTEEPGGLQFTGSQRVRHDGSNLPHTHTHNGLGHISCLYLWLYSLARL